MWNRLKEYGGKIRTSPRPTPNSLIFITGTIFKNLFLGLCRLSADKYIEITDFGKVSQRHKRDIIFEVKLILK